MAQLPQLIRLLGVAVSGAAIPQALTPRQVTRALITDGQDAGEDVTGSLLLAPHAVGRAAIGTALAWASERGAIGVVVKQAEAPDADQARHADERQCALLTLHPAASWTQVVMLLVGALEAEAFERGLTSERSAGALDLTLIADTAASLVGGPVIIVDPHFKLITYSGNQTAADEERTQTLLNRRMSKTVIEAARAAGVFQRLSQSAEPIVVTGLVPGMRARAVVAIRAGGHILGTMWAVVEHPSRGQLAGLAHCARLAATQLLRLSSEAEGYFRLESETLVQLIHGGPEATLIAQQFNLVAQAGHYRVVALTLRDTTPNGRARQRWRLYQRLQQLRLHSNSVTLAGELANTIYVILRCPPDDTEAVRGWLAALAPPEDEPMLAAGISQAAPTIEELPRARQEAERALAVARVGRGADPVVFFADAWADALLLRLRGSFVSAEIEQYSPLRLLSEHDRLNDTAYLASLRAWLETMGDVGEAARLLGVHVNTLRYRLNRLQELAQIDLQRPEVRLVLALQLALHS